MIVERRYAGDPGQVFERRRRLQMFIEAFDHAVDAFDVTFSCLPFHAGYSLHLLPETDTGRTLRPRRFPDCCLEDRKPCAALNAEDEAYATIQAFGAHRVHQPSGLIWPSTTLQVFDSAMKCTHPLHFCSPLG